MKANLTVAFLTSTDSRDRKSWSGINFHMLKSLEQQFSTVVPLGPAKLNMLFRFLTKLNDLFNRFSPWHYDIYHSWILSRYYAPIFERKLRERKFDVIFAPVSAVEIASLKTDVPIYYYSDSSISQLKGYYSNFSKLFGFSAEEAERIQQKALEKSAVVIHSSSWASEHVIKNYGVQEEQTFSVTMGANIDSAPDLEILKSRLTSKASCNLLLLGVDWERKGGPIAFEALVELNKMGLDTTLTVCGCVPPKEFSHPKMKVIPFLNKNKKEDYDRFVELLSNTHFLTLPTRAECSAIVFAEASAYGIPSITTSTGGVGSMVEDDVNGFMLPYEARGAEYARVIKTLFEDHRRYEDLVYSSRSKFDKELNWKSWGEKMKEIIVNTSKDLVRSPQMS
jgi:glycosyltransferase involved in cell wall biosynthesis